MDGSQLPSRDATLASRAEAPARPRLLRRLLLGAALVGAIAGGAAYGRYWFVTGRYLESTDDAYTAADAATIAPRVAGPIVAVLVTDNQRVRAGDALARIDDRDYRASLEAATADIASARADIAATDAQITQQTAAIAQAQADIDAARAALGFATADNQRYANLVKTGDGTVQRAEQASADIRQKAASLARAIAAESSARQQTDVLQATRARAVAAEARAQAASDQARLNLSRTTIAAPVDGAVGDRSVRLGQYVQAGTRLMDVVPTGRDIYVVANFKETQLAQMWRGERATLAVDMLGSHGFIGHVDSLAPGSGAQFALLPPENATGNFTKIVQRVPVKIIIDDADPTTLSHLRPGLSVTATVDTRTRPPGVGQTLVGEAEEPVRAAAE